MERDEASPECSRVAVFFTRPGCRDVVVGTKPNKPKVKRAARMTALKQTRQVARQGNNEDTDASARLLEIGEALGLPSAQVDALKAGDPPTCAQVTLALRAWADAVERRISRVPPDVMAVVMPQLREAAATLTTVAVFAPERDDGTAVSEWAVILDEALRTEGIRGKLAHLARKLGGRPHPTEQRSRQAERLALRVESHLQLPMMQAYLKKAFTLSLTEKTQALDDLARDFLWYLSHDGGPITRELKREKKIGGSGYGVLGPLPSSKGNSIEGNISEAFADALSPTRSSSVRDMQGVSECLVSAGLKALGFSVHDGRFLFRYREMAEARATSQ